MKENLTERVLRTVRNYGMLKAGDKVLAAVSGGPDSVFLLHALAGLKNKLKIKEICVCNIDHGLRGAESREDSLFVKKISGEMGLEFFHKKIDLNRLKSKELSTEEKAREERYKFFGDVARKAGSTVVATGHTLDDQAETVLMRFIKGSSLKGMVGISPLREEKRYKFIRPLIEIEKSEITEFLNNAGSPYRIDATNAEPLYFRNIVRKEIVPFLEKYNPKLKRSLFSLAEHLREDFQFIDGEKAKIKKIISKGRKSRNAEIKLKDIILQPKALQKEVLRDALDLAGGKVKKLSFRHWKELENLIARKYRGASVDLPGSIRATRTASSIIFNRI